jgi:hypothetical protein
MSSAMVMAQARGAPEAAFVQDALDDSDRAAAALDPSRS